MLKYFFRVKREKLNLNRSTWKIRRSSEKSIMLFDFESLHLLQPYIKGIDFPRDEGENWQNMLIFMLACSTPLMAYFRKSNRQKTFFFNIWLLRFDYCVY